MVGAIEVSTAKGITFSVDGSNSLHKLELSKTLLRFTEFDFTYFWEQCIEAGRNARKTGRISPKLENMALSAAAKCHPYVEACLTTEFSSLVLDCIIAYICHSEGIGLEELWTRCISPKSLYEKAIFCRVSEYKTGRGINQWINLVRIQEYARAKMKFIYETDRNVMLPAEDYRTRREYFDLAFSVAANETGCPMDEMPSVKTYSPSQLPGSVFMMGKVSKHIYRRLSETLENAQMWQPQRLNNHNRDSAALDAFSYVKDMPRPGEMDMRYAVEAVSAFPETIYVPDSFKAAIDMEFTCMYEEGIYLAKCPHCDRYFVRSLDEASPYCSRINASGKTCAQLMADGLGIASGKPVTAEAPENAESPENKTIEEVTEAAEEENIADEIESASRDTEFEPMEIPKELERRCQRAYNTLYKRIGKLMTAAEFKEWSQYLYDMKKAIRVGNADIEQLEPFLSYWETAVRKQSKKNRHKNNYSEQTLENTTVTEAEAAEEGVPTDEQVIEPPQEKNEEVGSGIAPAGTEIDAEGRVFKPFNPPKYNTVLEAMLDGKYKSDELLSEDSGEDDDITVKGRRITLPQWERITRS